MKSIKLMFLLSFFALCLWACGGASDKASTAKPGLDAVVPDGQEVLFWYQHTGGREAALLKLIDKFNQDNPHGIVVRGARAGDHDKIYQRVKREVDVSKLPQLVVAYRYQAQAYYKAGRVVDLTPYIESEKWGLTAEDKNDFVSGSLEQDNIDQVQVALLPNRSMEILYYNEEWLKELGYSGPPENWYSFVEMSNKAKDHPFSKSVDKKRSLGCILQMDASRLAAMVFSRGGKLIEENGSAYTLDTPEMRSSLQLLRELKDSGALETAGSSEEVQSSFTKGQALFALRSSAGVPLYAAEIEAGAAFDWNVAVVPYETRQPALNVYGASLAVCNSSPEQQLASWLFVKWFVQPFQQETWARGSNYYPVRKELAGQLSSFFRTPYEFLEYGKSEPWVVGYGAVREMIEIAAAQVLRGKDLDQVLIQLESQANKTL
jgi:multiple sugar transport system substrate-binding protein